MSRVLISKVIGVCFNLVVVVHINIVLNRKQYRLDNVFLGTEAEVLVKPNFCI